VKDIDIVAATAARTPDGVLRLASRCGFGHRQGRDQVSIRLSGMNADLRAVSEEEFPFALMYLTGSKDHNTTMGIAKKAGYKLNEYGLFKGERKTPCKSEEDILASSAWRTSRGDARGRGGDRGGRGRKMPDLVEE
jgi:DNA polymerase (family 10)